ncbi:MAG TPA: hypothetical protein V6C76_16385 [Drouetiella sp.]
MTTATGAPIASDKLQESNFRSAIFQPFKNPIARDFLLITALISINVYCFHRTLHGYFLADDFVHVPYLVKVFNGHPELLLQNFYSNWVQAQGTQFYRPFISLTLAFDYALWKANPVGYHITNFLYQIAATVFLFLTTRRLFHYQNQLEANSFGFLAGAFFAACPIHPEVVSWIIARVDSVQATFLLASFWLYLKARDGLSQNRVFRGLSLTCFAVALMSKEMAITLPPTLFLFELIKSDTSKKPLERVKTAALRTWQYWLAFGIYMIVRTLSLGTISGGYAGSIGEGLSSSLFKRWFQDGAFMRILFPINAELPAAAQRSVKTLKLLYEGAAALFIARLILLYREESLVAYSKRLLLAAGWFVIAMLPTYQVFNLTETLQGSRFIYLGTAPLCVLLSLLVAPIQFQNWCQYKRAYNILTGLLATALVWTFMQMTYQNNSAWAQANRGVSAFRLAIEDWFLDQSRKQSSTQKNLIVMNIPQRYAGSHMLYNAATLSVLLRPPLTKEDLAKRVLTFEPIEFGDSELLNIARLRRLIAQQDLYQFVRWDSGKQKLIPLNLNAAPTNKTINGSIETDSRSEGHESYLASPSIDVPSGAVDFVRIELTSDKPINPTEVISMTWNTLTDPDFHMETTMSKPIGNNLTVEFPVSEHKNWIMSGTIHQLKLELPNGVTVKKLTLQSGADLIPTLEPDLSSPPQKGRTVKEDEGGVSRPGRQIGPFKYDASKIQGADRVVFEISKADSWFEHYTGTYRDTSLSRESLIKQDVKPLSGQFKIPASELNRPGFYEIRVSAVDKNGKLIGYPSDPIDLQFSAEDIKK